MLHSAVRFALEEEEAGTSQNNGRRGGGHAWPQRIWHGAEGRRGHSAAKGRHGEGQLFPGRHKTKERPKGKGRRRAWKNEKRNKFLYRKKFSIFIIESHSCKSFGEM